MISPSLHACRLGSHRWNVVYRTDYTHPNGYNHQIHAVRQTGHVCLRHLGPSQIDTLDRRIDRTYSLHYALRYMESARSEMFEFLQCSTVEQAEEVGVNVRKESRCLRLRQIDRTRLAWKLDWTWLGMRWHPSPLSYVGSHRVHFQESLWPDAAEIWWIYRV